MYILNQTIKINSKQIGVTSRLKQYLVYKKRITDSTVTNCVCLKLFFSIHLKNSKKIGLHFYCDYELLSLDK